MTDKNDQDDTRQTQLPALGETELDSSSTADLNRVESEGHTNGTYQDYIDYRDSDTDPIAEEQSDRPADGFGIPEQEYKNELDKLGDNDMGIEDDDVREMIEDRDEGDNNAA